MFLFFKQETAYEMRISDWSSDVCSSDLTFTPSDSAAIGSSPQERRRNPNAVRHSTHQVSGNSARPSTTTRDRPPVRPRSAPPMSESTNHTCRASQPSTSGVSNQRIGPPARNSMSSWPTDRKRDVSGKSVYVVSVQVDYGSLKKNI